MEPQDVVARWRAILLLRPGDDPVHISPTFGLPHDLSAVCWCQPQQDSLEPRIFLHYPSN